MQPPALALMVVRGENLSTDGEGETVRVQGPAKAFLVPVTSAAARIELFDAAGNLFTESG